MCVCTRSTVCLYYQYCVSYEEEDACVSYEEEDTSVSYEEEDTSVSYEEEDTCVSYEEEDTCVSYEAVCLYYQFCVSTVFIPLAFSLAFSL